jgi:hypothetical protein
MMAIDDGISSQTIAPHIIQNPIPSENQKRPPKMRVSYTMSEVLE